MVGKVFWLGAVEADGRQHRRAQLEELPARARAQGVHPPRSGVSSVEGETEFAFLPRARPRRRVRPDPARGSDRASIARRRRGSSRSVAPRIRPRCSRTTTYEALELAEARGRSTSAALGRVGKARPTPMLATGPGALRRSRLPERLYDAALRLWPEDGSERAAAVYKRERPAGRRITSGGDLGQLEGGARTLSSRPATR